VVVVLVMLILPTVVELEAVQAEPMALVRVLVMVALNQLEEILQAAAHGAAQLMLAIYKVPVAGLVEAVVISVAPAEKAEAAVEVVLPMSIQLHLHHKIYKAVVKIPQILGMLIMETARG
jgi:hypothetical protein